MIRRAWFSGAAAWLVVLAGIVAPARFAAAQLAIPGGADPLRLLEQPRPAPEARPSGPAMRLEAPVQPVPEGADEIRFVVSELVVDGVTAYAPDVLRPLWQTLLGRESSLAELYGAAAAITTRYRNDGYILSRAVVPAQRIENGIVRLEVIEGYVGRVTIQGQTSRASLLHGYADKITALRPLRLRDLERYLLLIEDLPGTSVGSVLAPLAGVPGAAELTIEIAHKMVEGFVSADNRGTRYLGPFQGNVGGRLSSPLGFYDATQLRLIGTPADAGELKAYDLTQSVPLDADGTLLSFGVNQANARPGFTLKPLRVGSTALVASGTLSHPVIRSRREDLVVTASVVATDLHTDLFDGAQTLLNDRIRTFQAGFLYDAVDRWDGINVITLQLSQGLDVLSARTSGSPNLSRANGRSDFTKVVGEVQRVQSLGGNWSLLLAVSGQYGFTSLLASEQFALGGVNYARAYDPAELAGDSGIAGKLELQYGERSTGIGLASYQLYAYWDAGRIWNRQALPGEFTAASLTAAGVGARVVATDWLSGSLEIGKPLTRDVATEGDREPRVFFSLLARF